VAPAANQLAAIGSLIRRKYGINLKEMKAIRSVLAKAGNENWLMAAAYLK